MSLYPIPHFTSYNSHCAWDFLDMVTCIRLLRRSTVLLFCRSVFSCVPLLYFLYSVVLFFPFPCAVLAFRAVLAFQAVLASHISKKKKKKGRENGRSDSCSGEMNIFGDSAPFSSFCVRVADSTSSRIKWYLTWMCLLRSPIRGLCTKSRMPELSHLSRCRISG